MKLSLETLGTTLRVRPIFLPALTALALLARAPAGQADSWQQRSPAPGRRGAHSAVWTGREMIVWGGGVDGQFLNTGGRYDPASDTWRPTSLHGTPSPRWFHAAVWAGHEMIIWGGRPNFFGNDNLNDGARYNPTTDTWTPISDHGAPIRRSQCAAVWTGSEMIIWGGETEGGVPLADGARYNPATDNWTPINSHSGLEPRMEPSAIWTGTEMIVFGGVDATKPGWLSYGDGARYNPATDTWTPLPASGAPSSRTGHTAVWTGERMIVWGGRVLPSYEFLNDGAIYNPGSDTWTPVSLVGAAQARMLHAAAWTGSEMIIWGGQAGQDTLLLNTGARYNPAIGAWTPTTQNNAPGKRMFYRSDLGIWTGGGMLISCGSDYPASLDSTYLYTLVTVPCLPAIDQQPQDLTIAADGSASFSVSALDCLTTSSTSREQTSFGPAENRLVFETGARAGRLRIDYNFFEVPDSLRVYYDGQRILDTGVTNNPHGETTVWVPFGPGRSTSVEIVVNEGSGDPETVWEYAVTFEPPPLTYQWRKDGAPVTDATNATLTLSNVSVEDAGAYSVVVANANASVTSASATLTVLSPPTSCAPVPPGIVAWWPGEGNASDVVGSNQGELLGGVS